MYQRIKHIVEPVIALIVFILLSPLIVILLILTFVFSRENPLFIQNRVGYKEKEFKVIKIKTLYGNNSKPNSWGIFLRKTGLDELPQLVNIIKGEMSFVGPRPLLPYSIKYMSRKERKRHTIKPGITGLVQVNGRNKLSWKQRLEYDVLYAKTANFFLDIFIIFRTLFVIFSKDAGHNSGGKSTISIGIEEERDLKQQ